MIKQRIYGNIRQTADERDGLGNCAMIKWVFFNLYIYMIIPMPVVYVFLVIFNTCTYVACLHKLIIYGNYKNNKKQSLFFFLLIVKLKKKNLNILWHIGTNQKWITFRDSRDCFSHFKWNLTSTSQIKVKTVSYQLLLNRGFCWKGSATLIAGSDVGYGCVGWRWKRIECRMRLFKMRHRKRDFKRRLFGFV